MNQVLSALIVLIGELDKDWIPCLADEVEWTKPRYNHQN